MTDQQAHSTRRRLFAQPFSNSSILTYEASIREMIETAIAKVRRDVTVSEADVLKWFTFMATDVIGQLSFGRSFEMLQHEEVSSIVMVILPINILIPKQKNPYIHDLETTMMISGIRVELPLLMHLLAWLPFSPLRGTSTLRHRLDQYGEQAVQSHKEYVTSKQNLSSSSRSLFSKFMDQEKNSELSDRAIAEEASNLIVAGSDTTAVTLTYLVWAVLDP